MVDVQRFRPYNDSPKAPPLPDHVSEDIVNTVNATGSTLTPLASAAAQGGGTGAATRVHHTLTPTVAETIEPATGGFLARIAVDVADKDFAYSVS